MRFEIVSYLIFFVSSLIYRNLMPTDTVPMSTNSKKEMVMETFLEPIGSAKLKWTIKDFKTLLRIGGKTIKSPSFTIETTSGNPATNSGNPVTSSGNPATNSGNPIASSGYPATNSGNPATTSGNPVTSSGNPATAARSFHLEMELPKIQVEELKCPIFLVDETGGDVLAVLEDSSIVGDNVNMTKEEEAGVPTWIGRTTGPENVRKKVSTVYVYPPHPDSVTIMIDVTLSRVAGKVIA
jgi:hypothetical protein